MGSAGSTGPGSTSAPGGFAATMRAPAAAGDERDNGADCMVYTTSVVYARVRHVPDRRVVRAGVWTRKVGVRAGVCVRVCADWCARTEVCVCVSCRRMCGCGCGCGCGCRWYMSVWCGVWRMVYAFTCMRSRVRVRVRVRVVCVCMCMLVRMYVKVSFDMYGHGSIYVRGVPVGVCAYVHVHSRARSAAPATVDSVAPATVDSRASDGGFPRQRRRIPAARSRSRKVACG